MFYFGKRFTVDTLLKKIGMSDTSRQYRGSDNFCNLLEFSDDIHLETEPG